MSALLAQLQTGLIWTVWVVVNIALGMSVGIWAAVLIPGWRALLATPIRVDEEAINQMSLLADDRAEIDELIRRWREGRRRAWWIIGILTALWLIYPALLAARAIGDLGAMRMELTLVGSGFAVGLLGVMLRSLWTRSSLREVVPVAADWRWAAGSYRSRERELRDAMSRLQRDRAKAEREKSAAEAEWMGEAEQVELLMAEIEELRAAHEKDVSERDELIDRLNERLAPELRLSLDGSLVDSDPLAAFLRDIERTWIRRYSESDRNDYPLRNMSLGWSFLESVDAHDVDRDKLLEVCVDVATRRVHQVRGREAHRLRVGRGGNDDVRVRTADGAKGWRCAIKRNAPQAPRLHWWEAEGGGVEFACIVRHDDFSIPE